MKSLRRTHQSPASPGRALAHTSARPMLLANGVALLLLPHHRCPAPPQMRQLVVEQGDGWLVANKPRGMVVHDGPGNLIDALADAGHRGTTPCHRLDAETSGLILMSSDPERTGALIKCLEAPATTKQYRGIVKGALKGGGVWDQPISPKPEGRKNPRGVAKSRVDAQTGYTALAGTPFLTAVDFTLGSGRTHQIRKHAAAKGHHIVGDTRYGEPKHAAMMSERFGFDGMALHAACLRLSIDGVEREFTAPLPTEWSALLEQFDQLPPPSPVAAVLRRPERAQGKSDPGERGARYTGEVASWNEVKGYGFIRREGKGLANLYVHHRSLEGDGFRALQKGETVMFDVGAMEDGRLEARRVTGPGGEAVKCGGARPDRASGKGAAEAKRRSGDSTEGGALPPGAYQPKVKKQ